MVCRSFATPRERAETPEASDLNNCCSLSNQQIANSSYPYKVEKNIFVSLQVEIVMRRVSINKNMANLISFDIEGFIEATHDIMEVPQKYLSKAEESKEIEVNTMSILEMLNFFEQKATFFVLGRIARDMPGLVRSIANAGHEIGCHSFNHRRLYNFNRSEVKDFLMDAKNYLEDAIGNPVYGFRAPDFSITNSNLWVFEILREIGFLYDSSVYPTTLHDVYGMVGLPKVPFRFPNGLIEIPLSVISLFNQNIPFGGGGYLRIYPQIVTRLFFYISNIKGFPGVIYLHPFEIGPYVIRVSEKSLFRKFRTYYGINTIRKKLSMLFSHYKFMTFKDYIDKHLMELVVYE
jgi:polysaccharide deacetylase family protein (PEP-CTERM system associated)